MTPDRVVPEGRVEHVDARWGEIGEAGQDGDRDVRRIGVPAAAARAQQACRSVVRAAAAQEDAELREVAAGVGVGGEVGCVSGVERQRPAFERTTGAALAIAGRDRARHADHARLGLPDDEPVERRARLVEVVRAHRDVVPEGGDHGFRLRPPYAFRGGHGGRVLERRPARDDDEVGRPRGKELLGARQKRGARARRRRGCRTPLRDRARRRRSPRGAARSTGRPARA